jgi:hypothetical protein
VGNVIGGVEGFLNESIPVAERSPGVVETEISTSVYDDVAQEVATDMQRPHWDDQIQEVGQGLLCRGDWK